MKYYKKLAAVIFTAIGLCSAFAQEIESAAEENFDDDELVFEGEGLTFTKKIEAEPEQTPQSGISVGLSKEQMDTTSRSGLIEDVMSSVVTLPGMTYSGQWNKEPSVRGGYPREMSCVLDGCYLIYPWHWGGAYSIFAPTFVKSTKLSNGIYSAKYGRATSGLLEIESVKPDEFHFEYEMNYTASTAFISAPIGDKAGILFGGKLTYLETLVYPAKAILSNETLDAIKRPPYIRDFYTKGFFNPTDKLTFTANLFFGSDGIEIDGEDEDEDSKIKTDAQFDYNIYNFLAGVDGKFEATDDLTFHGSASYNIVYEDLVMDSRSHGFVRYNPEFISRYGSLLSAADLIRGGYFLDQKDHYTEKMTDSLLQGKLDSEYRFSDASKIALGAEEIFTYSEYDSDTNAWTERKTDPTKPYPLFEKINYSRKTTGNKIFNTGAFILWNFGNKDTLLSGELGLRYDQLYIDGDGFTMNSLPDFNPRASIAVTPIRDAGIFDRITFSAGSGLFSSVPMLTSTVSKNDDINRHGMHMDRTFMAVLGTEFAAQECWSLKLEGYYKQYLNRLYAVVDDRNPADPKTHAYTDGIGHVGGFDLMLSKTSGMFSGYLTYSFIYARYKNPTKPQYDNQRTAGSGDDPLDEWYFPSFHRFNNLNLVINFKPTENWTFTLKGVFATGTPRTDGEKYCYPVRLADGTIQQRYTRNWYYSDTLRTDFSCPIDFRIAYGRKLRHNSNWKWEAYLGAEDIFQNLYSPEGSQKFDQNTGKNAKDSKVNFSLGIPMISMGFKLSC